MRKQLSLLLSLLLAIPALAGNVLGTDPQYRKKVYADFHLKQQQLPSGNLFSVMERKDLTADERDALTFLYAYMTASDAIDYTGDFYLEQIRSTLSTRNTAAWNSNIPDMIFRHFVLPVRVNNENLDHARLVFPKELLPRLKGLNAYDAILEVNHWCHEKVVYTPSDSRTSSPLASVKTAYGRCGEESTFLVAALRSVGIPARQVYTPRWAHTDDNHAWVEAWADGKWYFLGACEPEPVLNLGWFNAPASRGMLMHTRVFGAYNGPEDVMKRTPNYTEINITENYATTAHNTVQVVDRNGKPVPDANIEFRIYNYAEFFPASRKTTDAQGKASLQSGLGDIFVLASKDNTFGIGKLSSGKQELTTIVLDKMPNEMLQYSFHIVPPKENNTLPPVTEAQKAENTRRMAEEDSIRNAYVQTFATRETAKRFAEELKLDTARIADLLIASRGNHDELKCFLKQAVQANKGKQAVNLLFAISLKDLRDTPADILLDHLLHTSTEASSTEVLNPRVSVELLSAYRRYFQEQIPADLQKAFREDPDNLVAWCRNNLTLRNDISTVKTIASPIGTWRSRVVTSESRKVFFVAMARSLGIAAWEDPVDGKVYYKHKERTVFANFDSEEKKEIKTGMLQMTFEPQGRMKNPAYYSHFTLSKWENGTFQLLNYPEDGTWESLFKNPNTVESGYYMLTSGNRMANGSVLTEVTFFPVATQSNTVAALRIPVDKEAVNVIGNCNSEETFLPIGAEKEVSILSTTGRGYFVIGLLEPNKEPTNHALKDIEKMKEEIEAWGRTMIFLFANESEYRMFRPQDFPNLPKNVVFGIDVNGKIRKQITDNMKSPNGGALPIIYIGDTFNRVVFESEGYTIGMGEQLLKVIHGL